MTTYEQLCSVYGSPRILSSFEEMEKMQSIIESLHRDESDEDLIDYIATWFTLFEEFIKL